MEILEKATLAAGCFWCAEAIFKRLKGVKKVVSGYSGGDKENPKYDEVASGKTGHAESIQIEFDPKTISYEKLLKIFFHLHNPTTLNQQGADIGTQYRSAIFYHNLEQKIIAEKVKEKIEKGKVYERPIVTEIAPYKNFYKAENHHQEYYEKNKETAYCKVVIDPKLQKLLREFREDVAAS